jgi:hypothetical protein
VKVFPVWGAGGRPGCLQLRVEKAVSGTVVSVKRRRSSRRETAVARLLVDVSALEQPYEALEVDWREDSPSFATNLRVEASDDLRSWSTVVSQAPLVRIDYGGQRLEQCTVEVRAPLRNTAPVLDCPRIAGAAEQGRRDGRPAAGVDASQVRLGGALQELERAWKDVRRLPAKPGEYMFDLGGRFRSSAFASDCRRTIRSRASRCCHARTQTRMARDNECRGLG